MMGRLQRLAVMLLSGLRGDSDPERVRRREAAAILNARDRRERDEWTRRTP